VNGGYGIGEPLINTRVKGIAKPEVDEVRVQRETTWRETEYEQIMADLSLPILDRAELTKVCNADAVAVAVGDGIPGLTRLAYKNWQTQLQEKKIKINVKNKNNLKINFDLMNGMMLKVANADDLPATNYGSHAYEFEQKSMVSKLRKVTVDIDVWFKARYPEIGNKISKLTNLTHRDAELYLSGGLPTFISDFNPLISAGVTATVAALVDITAVPKGRLADIWCQVNRFVIGYFKKQIQINQLFCW
jgi:hypothetical protein